MAKMSCRLLCALLLATPIVGQTKGETPPPKQSAKPGQEKQKVELPKPPKGQDPLPPILEPARDAVERRDLIQRFRGRHPLEGFYRVKRMIRSGSVSVANTKGYLVIGQGYLSMQIYAPSDLPYKVNIQSFFRRIRVRGDKIEMTSLVGHRNKPNGDIVLEKAGEKSSLRYVILGGVLRLYRGVDEYIEFERVE